MKKSYLTTAFQKAAEQFPDKAEALVATFEARFAQLRRENAGATPEKQRH